MALAEAAVARQGQRTEHGDADGEILCAVSVARAIRGHTPSVPVLCVRFRRASAVAVIVGPGVGCKAQGRGAQRIHQAKWVGSLQLHTAWWGSAVSAGSYTVEPTGVEQEVQGLAAVGADS